MRQLLFLIVLLALAEAQSPYCSSGCLDGAVLGFSPTEKPVYYLRNPRATLEQNSVVADVFTPDDQQFASVVINYVSKSVQKVDSPVDGNTLPLQQTGFQGYSCQFFLQSVSKLGIVPIFNYTWALYHGGDLLFNISGIETPANTTQPFCWVSTSLHVAYLGVPYKLTSSIYYASLDNPVAFATSNPFGYSNNGLTVCLLGDSKLYDSDGLLYVANHPCCTGTCNSYYHYNSGFFNQIVEITNLANGYYLDKGKESVVVLSSSKNWADSSLTVYGINGSYFQFTIPYQSLPMAAEPEKEYSQKLTNMALAVALPVGFVLVALGALIPVVVVMVIRRRNRPKEKNFAQLN